MREFLFFWVGSSIMSFLMDLGNEMRIFKDAADAGYKIKMEKLSELGKQVNTNEKTPTSLLNIIPLVNILIALQRTIQYNNIRTRVLNQLSVMDVLEEMTEIEKSKYLSKPTIFNALIISVHTEPELKEPELKQASSVIIKYGDEYSEIFYKINESFDDIVILKVNGPASKWTIEEQKDKVANILIYMYESEIDKFEEEEIFIEKLKNNYNLNLKNNRNEEQSSNDISVNEQKQSLENFKDELNEEINPAKEEQINKKSTYTRTRKK